MEYAEHYYHMKTTGAVLIAKDGYCFLRYPSDHIQPVEWQLFINGISGEWLTEIADNQYILSKKALGELRFYA